MLDCSEPGVKSRGSSPFGRPQLETNTIQMQSQLLVDVAMGRKPADMVVRGARWVSVQSGEILDDSQIAIAGERIAYVGEDASHTIGDETIVIEADGRHAVPGLLDGHMHIESGMLTITQFVRAVIPHGTTGMFVDPHEMATIFGLEGVRLMVEEAALQPIHVWVQMPSCVPSAPGLETAGARIGPHEVAQVEHHHTPRPRISLCGLDHRLRDLGCRGEPCP